MDGEDGSWVNQYIRVSYLTMNMPVYLAREYIYLAEIKTPGVDGVLMKKEEKKVAVRKVRGWKRAVAKTQARDYHS